MPVCCITTVVKETKEFHENSQDILSQACIKQLTYECQSDALPLS
jgi:hypothetical protein